MAMSGSENSMLANRPGQREGWSWQARRRKAAQGLRQGCVLRAVILVQRRDAMRSSLGNEGVPNTEHAVAVGRKASKQA